MEATDKSLVKFLRNKQQLTVPIYQRKYSWKEEQCRVLFDDIENLAKNDDIKYHFLGSVVSVKSNSNEDVAKPLIIDGQQRVTSILLLILAIIRQMENQSRKKQLMNYYIENQCKEDDLKYKIRLTEEDQKEMENIIEERNIESSSSNLKNNFLFFQKKIKEKDLETLILGIDKLTIVDIKLNADDDNPQVIFESLNSTGLDLSQSDLIRNYILMNKTLEEQNRLYNNYWHPMEKILIRTDWNYFDEFVRDYLTVKNDAISNIKNVYQDFKSYLELEKNRNTEDLLKDMLKNAEYFSCIWLSKEPNNNLQKYFSSFVDKDKLTVAVVKPLLLQVYDDYKQEVITVGNFEEILQMLESYVVRRIICGVPTNSLNRFFVSFYKKIEKENYLQSFKANMIIAENNNRYPKDTELKAHLIESSLYGRRNMKFVLDKFENSKNKEKIDLLNYSKEHIMPQTLTDAWKKDLGDNWQEVHEKYLHTLGNLTLTMHNSEMSNKSFEEKKKIGFDNSRLHLNRSFIELEKWDEKAIKKRAEEMASELIKIIPYPQDIDEEILERYKK